MSENTMPTAPMWNPSEHDVERRRTVNATSGEPKSPSDSAVCLSHIMSTTDTNLYGTVHGGVVMKLVDDAAAASAARHASGPAVTAHIDGMTFVNPALVGDLLKVDAVVARAGRTSMDLHVVVTAQRWNESGEEREIVRAFLTFVAVDESGRPRPVPPLVPRTDAERAVHDEAMARRRG